MTTRPLWVALFVFFLFSGSASAQTIFIDRLAEGVYATVAPPKGEILFNSLFWIGDEHVAAVGSCLDAEVLAELASVVAAVTDKPLRYCILAHNAASSISDPSLSSDLALILEWNHWQRLRENPSPFFSSFLYFRDELTLDLAGRSVTLLADGRGGGFKVYLPEEAVLYLAAVKSPDCGRRVRLPALRKRSVPWQAAQQLGADIIVPACGSPVNSR